MQLLTRPLVCAALALRQGWARSESRVRIGRQVGSERFEERPFARLQHVHAFSCNSLEKPACFFAIDLVQALQRDLLPAVLRVAVAHELGRIRGIRPFDDALPLAPPRAAIPAGIVNPARKPMARMRSVLVIVL
ncbi:MAG: hypothetical protein L0271_17525 [Gemmatimonadetes bacterium]|nr:hypothetical protein [Gemmatimonadota bacterium]